MQQISAAELSKQLQAGKGYQVVDVRSPFEFRMGHIRDSINIPMGRIHLGLEGVDPGQNVVLVCASGSRSAAVYQQLSKGYPKLHNLQGGMGSWGAERLPVAHGPVTERAITRQAHFFASVLIILAFYLSATQAPQWIYLAALPAFGLMLDSLTGFCPVSLLLKAMPWNRSD